MTIAEQAKRLNTFKQQLKDYEISSIGYNTLQELIADLELELKETIANEPLFSKIPEKEFVFPHPPGSTKVIHPNTINFGSIVLPNTKPKKMDYDIIYISIELTKENLPEILNSIDDWQGVPIYLRTNIPVPKLLIHKLSFSPFSCVIFNVNTIDRVSIRNALATITACAMTAQLNMFCDTNGDLAKALLLMQETAGINRYPWKICLSTAMAEYEPYLLQLAYYFRNGIEIIIENNS